MFSNADIDVINVISSWRKPKAREDHTTQTQGVIKVSQESNSLESSNVTSQTEEISEIPLEMGEDTNPSATLEFLLRVEPEVTRILKQNMISHAFDGCYVSWTSSRSNGESKTSRLFTLEPSPHPDSDKDMPVTALTWSATGSVIAAGYGRLDHVDLCWHRASISTWNIDRHSSRVAKPDSSVVVECCVMSLAFHPERAVVLAGGVFNGKIHVWDLSIEEEPRIASTVLLQFGHTDPVNQIAWIESPAKSRFKQFNILSVGGEGKMIIWELDFAKKSLTPMFQYNLVTSNIPKSIRVSKGKAQDAIGISSADLSHFDSKTFIIGAETGNVFKCSLHGVVLSKRTLNEVAIEENIVSLAFTPHIGPVYGVSSSPFDRNMFLTCGTDATLSIFSMLDTQPLLKIDVDFSDYMFSAEWSPFRPTVFVCGTGKGEILIFDLSHSKIIPVDKIQPNTEKQPVYVLKFNKKRRQLLATGDGTGTVVIWELSSELCNEKLNEMKVLDRIGSKVVRYEVMRYKENL